MQEVAEEEASGALAVPSWDSAAYGAVEVWRTGAALAAGGAERSARAASPAMMKRRTASGKEHL